MTQHQQPPNINPWDHPERTMRWTAPEIKWIQAYATRHAIDSIEHSRTQVHADVSAWLESQRIDGGAHGFEAVGVEALSRMWSAARASASAPVVGDSERLVFLYSGRRTESCSLVDLELRMLNGHLPTMLEVRSAIDAAMAAAQKGGE